MRKFVATLVTPPSEEMKQVGLRQRMRLSWMPDPSAHEAGMLVYGREKTPLHSSSFRELRDTLGSWIQTNDPQKVCRVLGLPTGESGIVRG